MLLIETYQGVEHEKGELHVSPFQSFDHLTAILNYTRESGCFINCFGIHSLMLIVK